MGKIYFSAVELYGHSGQIILKRVLQHCLGVQKEFPGYSTSLAGNSSKILVAVPSRKIFIYISWIAPLGEKFQDGERKNPFWVVQTNFPYEQWLFPGKGSKYIQEFDSKILQCSTEVVRDSWKKQITTGRFHDREENLFPGQGEFNP
jgi:hypothetical protein